MTLKNYLLILLILVTKITEGYGQIGFTQILKGSIVENKGNSHGAAWGDYNNDGWVDLFVANLNGPDFLFKNSSGKLELDNTFPSDSANSAAAAWGDIDNDGDLDLMVARGSTLESVENALYINENGTLKIADKEIFGELLIHKGYTENVAWVDFNHDGLLDLVEVNWKVQPVRIYLNDPSGKFKMVEYNYVTNILAWSVTANCIDYDGDGYQDLFVTRQGYTANAGNGQLYHLSDDNHLSLWNPEKKELQFIGNRKQIPFTSDGGNSITSSWGDCNNDGILDLFVGNFWGEQNFLYLSDKTGKYSKVIIGPIVEDKNTTVGSAWGDVDNDGDLDLFISNGYTAKESNMLYVNQGNGVFTKHDGLLSKDQEDNVGAVFADFDNDGDLDLFVTTRDNKQNLLYRNENQNKNGWIKLKLIGGNNSNRMALGATLKVEYVENGESKIQFHEIHQQTGYGGHNDLTVHFGLGLCNTIHKITIKWPSGKATEFADLKSNNHFLVDEDKNTIVNFNPLGKK